MHLKYVFLICLYVGCSFGDDLVAKKFEESNSFDKADDLKTTTKAPTTISPTSTSTSKTPITTVPTSSPTPPSTTQPPTTPSPSPTTPSPSPTTPSPSPTTPSPSPTTTTSSPTIPPPTPTPSSVWTVTNETSNIACIVAKMDITLEVIIGNENATFKANPKTVKAQGKCGEMTQTLEIIWPSVSDSYGSLAFMFKEQDKKYFIGSVVMNISGLTFSVKDTENVTLFQTGQNTSYSCPTFELHWNQDNKTSVNLSMNDIHIEAFRLTNSTKFSSATHCPNGDVPDMVPIIVGLALAALVIIVVIGYFIGRMRSQARGYLSM